MSQADAPPSNEFRNSKDKLVQFFARHFVSLSGVHRPMHRQGELDAARITHAFNISGFVVSVADHWLWVTAGHVFDDIDRLPQQGRVIDYCRFNDGWTPSSVHNDPIPVEIDALRSGRVGKASGWDCALYPLSPIYRRLLESNGVEALSEEAWASPPDLATVGCCLLLGIPEALTERCRNPSGGRPCMEVRMACTLHNVVPISDPPPEFTAKSAPRIYGKVQMDGPMPLDNIQGMSGGPLFCVKTDPSGAVRYWVIGVQSTWHKPTQTIEVLPILPLLDALRSQLEAQA